MRIITYIIALIILLAGVIFACLNAEPVKLNFYLGAHTIPLSLLLVVTLGIGLLVGLMASAMMYIKLKSENYRLKNRIKMTQKEVENLRTMPLKNDIYSS